MIATVRTTQYERCRGSTSLNTAATPVQIISRMVNSQAMRPPMSRSSRRAACSRTRSRSPGCRAAGAGGGVELPEMQRASATIASRSASAPAEDDHGGGMNDGAVSSSRSVSTASASRSMVSVTHGGGRSPELRSAVAASTIWWLRLRIAISRMSSSLRPLAADRPVSSVSYAVFRAVVTARRVFTTSGVPIARRPSAMAW